MTRYIYVALISCAVGLVASFLYVSDRYESLARECQQMNEQLITTIVRHIITKRYDTEGNIIETVEEHINTNSHSTVVSKPVQRSRNRVLLGLGSDIHGDSWRSVQYVRDFEWLSVGTEVTTRDGWSSPGAAISIGVNF